MLAQDFRMKFWELTNDKVLVLKPNTIFWNHEKQLLAIVVQLCTLCVYICYILSDVFLREKENSNFNDPTLHCRSRCLPYDTRKGGMWRGGGGGGGGGGGHDVETRFLPSKS